MPKGPLHVAYQRVAKATRQTIRRSGLLTRLCTNYTLQGTFRGPWVSETSSNNAVD